MNKIKFNTGSSSPFFSALNREVEQLLSTTNILSKAKKRLWFKMVFYFILYLGSYLILFFLPHTFWELVLNYVSIGLSGILLAFNVSHDACHETFSRNRKINSLLYHLSFNMQGPNAYLWKIRHTASHHLFPNVDGCDADIDDNPIIRLSPQHPFRNYQRYQHLYSFFVYCFYTLHWFLFKDFLYLFKKKVANLHHKIYPLKQYIFFFLWKIAYLAFLIFLPIYAGYSAADIILSFFAMHIVSALFFIHVLITTHLCMETQFPKVDDNGFLPNDYYVHQLLTSLEYSPTNKIFNWLFGGFNSHAAHHLYPKLPHTIYPVISKLIEQKAGEFNVRYNKLTLPKAVRSHYRYLKMMGRPSEGKKFIGAAS